MFIDLFFVLQHVQHLTHPHFQRWSKRKIDDIPKVVNSGKSQVHISVVLPNSARIFPLVIKNMLEWVIVGPWCRE